MQKINTQPPIHMLKIIQITDCHLLEDPQALLQEFNTNQSFIQVLNKVSAHHPDCLILSGDLSEDGSLKSYQRLHQALMATGLKFFALPGNHDNINNMRTVFKDKLLIDCSIQLGAWRFIMLNSVAPGVHHGLLADTTLNTLKHELNQHTETPTAVFVHHHPVDTQNPFINRYNIHNAAALLKILESANPIKFVAFGHIHHALSTLENDIAFLGTPSSCFQFKGDIDGVAIDTATAPGYRVFELLNTGLFRTWVETI